MTQREAIERLAKFIYVNPSESDDWFEARQLYVKVLSEQTAAYRLKADILEKDGAVAEWAREQTHAIIEMLEV